jgi:hypothetical protein
MRTISLNLRLLTFVFVLCLSLITISSKSLAQDEPTDVPFPTSAVTATPSVPVEATLEVTAEVTAALTIDDALATSAAAISESDHLRTENKALQEAAASAQSDKGATLYALIIVVIGLMLAFAVFFGLRRSGS